MPDTTHIHKAVVSLIDDGFDPQNLQHYHLSVEVNNDALAYAVLDLERNKYLLLERFMFQHAHSSEQLAQEIKQVFYQKGFRWNNFKSQSMVFFSPKFTLVPSALFDVALTQTYLDFNSPVLESEVVIAGNIKNFESHCVYAVQRDLAQTLQDLFPAAKRMHTFGPLLEILAASFKNKSGKNVLVHLQQGHFELIVVEEQKLLFANIFDYKSAEDFLYYLLFVFEQLKINPEKTDVLLLGEVEKNSAIYSIMTKYIRNIHFGSRPEQFEYSYVFDGTARHFYYNLFSQSLCV